MPAIIQWATVLVVAVLPLALLVDAVRRLWRASVVGSNASWRQRSAYVGAASSLFVYALPVMLLIHNMFVISNAPWRSALIQYAMNAFVVLSVVLAIVGPKNVRPQLIISALLPFFFWLFVPRGIL
jgi:hypothetical protein